MLSSKKIIIVNDYGHINGGASQVALTSAIGLAGKGHDVTLFAGVAPVMEELLQANVRVVCLEQSDLIHDPHPARALCTGIWNSYAARQFKELLRNFNPKETVVHIHSWTKYFSSSIFSVCWEMGFRPILTMHDFFLSCPNGGFYNYKAQKICALEPCSLACLFVNCDKRSYIQKVWRFVRQKVQQLVARVPGRVQYFISVSDFSCHLLESALPVDANVFSVDNPVIMDKGDRVLAECNRKFAMVGRLDPEKGGGLFAEAAQRCGVPALFVGDGPLRTDVASRYPAAEITGWVGKVELRRYLRQARALVFPSLWYETQGLVVLEAAAMGIPSIVADSCAAAEFVENGVTGLIFRGGDSKDLAEKLTQLTNDRVIEGLSQNAYKRYWARPSTMDQHLAQLEDVYCAVCY